MKKFLFIFLCTALLFAAILPTTVLAQPDEESDTDWGDFSEETFWEMMGFETIDEMMDWIAQWSWYKASDNSPFWMVWGDDSKEDFMRIYELDEEEYQEVEEAWQRAWKQAKEEQRLQYLQEIEELGGTADIINIMYNGAFVKFTDVTPEKTDGLTFVPIKPFFEALGATVSYNAKTKMITAEFADFDVGFVAGRDTMSLTENETTREHPLEVAPYIKNGVSFIPVRAVAESLGLDVYWDYNYKSVVIIDSKKITEEIDKDYTILNRLLSMPLVSNQTDSATYKSVMDMLITITQFDSLDGDKLSKLAANFTTVSDGRNMSMAGEIDVTDLISLITGEIADYQSDDDDEGTALLEKLKKLQKIKAELIFNYDKAVLYFRAPILSLLADEIPQNAWLSMHGLDEYYDFSGTNSILQSFGLEKYADGISVGKILTSVMASNNDTGYYDYIYLYGKLMDRAKAIATLIGDDNFKKNGGDYILTLTTEDLYDAIGKTDFYLSYQVYELDLKLTIKVKDDEIIGISGRFVTRTRTYDSAPVTRILCDFDINRENVKLSLEVHAKNTMKVSADINVKTAVTGEHVQAAPPEGDKIIPIEDLQENDDVYWPELVEQLAASNGITAVERQAAGRR